MLFWSKGVKRHKLDSEEKILNNSSWGNLLCVTFTHNDDLLLAAFRLVQLQ